MSNVNLSHPYGVGKVDRLTKKREGPYAMYSDVTQILYYLREQLK